MGGIDYAAINGELKELEGKVSSALVLPYFQGRSTPRRAYFCPNDISTIIFEFQWNLLQKM